MTDRFRKELFSIQLGEVAKTCEKLLKKPEQIPEGWKEAVEDMKLRASAMSKDWKQTK